MSTSFTAIPLEFLIKLQGEAEARAQIQSLGGAFQNFGNDAATAASKADGAAESNEKVKVSFKDTIQAFNDVASSATTLYNAYDDLADKQLRIEKAEAAVTSAENSLTSARNKLNEMTAKGIASGPEYEKQLSKVEGAEERLTLATKNVEKAQGDMQEAQIKFALDVVPTVISMASSLQIGLRGLSAANFGVATSAPAAGAGMRGVGTAMRATLAAMGPVGWVLLGISAAMTIVATNAFGVRDAINEMGKRIGDAVPILKPLLEGLNQLAATIFPESASRAEEMNARMDASMKETASSTASSITEQSSSLSDMNTAYAQAQESVTKSMQTMQDSITSSSTAIIKQIDELEARMSSIGISGGMMAKSAADSLAGQMQNPGTQTPPAASSAATDLAKQEQDKQAADRLAVLDKQISDMRSQIAALGGGLGIERLRELGFDRGAGGATMGNQITQLFAQLAPLEDEKKAILDAQDKAEKDAIAAKYAEYADKLRLPKSKITSMEQGLAEGSRRQTVLAYMNALAAQADQHESKNITLQLKENLNLSTQVLPMTKEEAIRGRSDAAMHPWMYPETMIVEIGGEPFEAYVKRIPVKDMPT
ncbi:hypothetical protein [Nitrososphaera viennensis]|uniref:Tail tape measure protein n=2 Tax=Nitrososphaera viennensis TaxID=1034015 RepID=A0A977IDP4_9ARCH|nr:hypothetical protein [Nitrososphaera viennensis]AIC16955.1 putative tail tape measure protein [Nitrososphaera viennensis EN76]UVS68858.1 hypothetical protein NWT39_13235 [Nitrososphaera viennensis]CBX88965.1 putative tail tape measure protein [Nitrososphaera phage Pro-Nvie1]